MTPSGSLACSERNVHQRGAGSDLDVVGSGGMIGAVQLAKAGD